MNNAVYRAAKRAGCTHREAETIATYVESESVADAAHAMGIKPRTAKSHLAHVRERINADHLAAAVAKLLTEQIVAPTRVPWNERVQSQAATLYRFYDVDNVLVYVGITVSPARLAQHSRARLWWQRVTNATFEHFQVRSEAIAAELAAIIAERPQFNTIGQPNENVA